VSGAVQSLIGWLSRIHVPKISLPHIGGKSVTGATAPGVPMGASTRGLSAQAAASTGGVTINITGALDPEGVARQVQRLLANHDRRVGLVRA
jgi:hypothetical protein